MELNYSQRLKLLHAICLAETRADGAMPSTDLSDYDVFDAARRAFFAIKVQLEETPFFQCAPCMVLILI